MANTFELIASSTVGSGGAAYIEFTSIPSTYTDICIKYSARNAYAGVDNVMTVLLNGASTNFNFKSVYGTGSSATSNDSGGTNQYIGWTPGANATSNVFGNGEIYIPNYAGSTYKSISADTVTENNATAVFQGLIAGLWSNTAAITSIRLASRDANLVQYSSFYLYGVRSS